MTGADPVSLIPGDPAGIAADARLLADRAARLADVGETLRRMDTGAWTGRAADTWHEQYDSDVARWLQGADSLDAAAQALQVYAETLSWAQREAARAVTLSPDAGRDVLERARAQVRETGDRVAAALRGEAALAPRDSVKQSDAEFYGGIWQSVSDAGAGAWQLLSDPAGAAANVVAAAADPAGTARDAVAWDDWTQGREPRALGRNTGDLLIGVATLGAGKITSALGRGGRHHGRDEEPDSGAPPAGARPGAQTPQARVEAVRRVVVGDDGRPRGVQDSKGVYLIDDAQLERMRRELHAGLGEPTQVLDTPKGRVETWTIGDGSRANITYRSYSASGGATIDVNRVDDVPVARYHIANGGP